LNLTLALNLRFLLYFTFLQIDSNKIHIKKVPVGQSDSGSVEVLITNAKFSDEGDYLCYGYPTDRSVYDVKAIKVTVGNVIFFCIKIKNKSIKVNLIFNSNK